MPELLLSYLIERPRRLIDFGRSLFTVGAFLILLGVIARAATSSVAAVYQMVGQGLAEVTLASTIPSIPTWWVPEGPAGFSMAGFCLVAGLVVARAGRFYERLLRH